MNILLKGYYGFGNFGDDLLMLISFRLLKEKYPESRITIFSNNTKNLKNYTHKAGYNKYIFKIVGEEVPLIDWTNKAHFDLVFEGGGGTYFDDMPKGWMYFARNAIIRNFGSQGLVKLDLFLRKLTNKQRNLTWDTKIAIGIGVGPFNKSSKHFYDKLIGLASLDFLMVRDNTSLSFAKKHLRVNTIKKGSDLAFLTTFWNVPDFKSAKQHQKIGFILKGDKNSFVKNFHHNALLFKEAGWEVAFFSFDEHVDAGFIIECQKFFNVDIWQPHNISLNNYINRLQECTILVTERAHGAIIGSILGCVPYFASPNFKMKQIISLFKNTSSKHSMEFKEGLELQDICQIQGELEERKKLLRIDSTQNLNIVEDNINFGLN